MAARAMTTMITTSSRVSLSMASHGSVRAVSLKSRYGNVSLLSWSSRQDAEVRAPVDRFDFPEAIARQLPG